MRRSTRSPKACAAYQVGVLQALALPGRGRAWRCGAPRQPRSLLDNQPLRELLQAELSFECLSGLLAAGHLRGLAVTASSHARGEHLSLYDAVGDMQDWARTQRRALHTRIDVEHLMASSAIPVVFLATCAPASRSR